MTPLLYFSENSSILVGEGFPNIEILSLPTMKEHNWRLSDEISNWMGGGRHTPLCIADPSWPSPPSAPPCWCSRCRCCRTPGTRPSRRPSGRNCSSGSPAPRPGSPSCSWPRPSRSRPAHLCEKRAQSSDSWSARRIRKAWGPELQNVIDLMDKIRVHRKWQKLGSCDGVN